MAIDSVLGVFTIYTVKGIVRIQIKDYIGLLALTIVESNVRKPNIVQYNTKKTNQQLVSAWS